MKRVSLLLIFAFLTSMIMGQRISSKDLDYQIKHYPAKPIPPRFKCYSVDVTVAPGHPSLDAKNYNLNLDLNGLEKKAGANNPKDCIEIEIILNKVKTSPIKTTKITRGYTTFVAKSNIQYKVDYVLSGKKANDDNGKYEQHKYYSGKIVKNVMAQETGGTELEAKSKMESWALDKKVEEVVQQVLNETINDRINDEFMLYNANRTIKFYTVDKFKRFDYSDFNSAREIAFKATQTFIKEKDLPAYKKAITPARQIWAKALKESNLNKRKSRVNKEITCYALLNLANTSFLLRDYRKAQGYLDRIQSIDKRFDAKPFFRNGDQIDQKRIKKYNEMKNTPDFKDV